MKIPETLSDPDNLINVFSAIGNDVKVKIAIIVIFTLVLFTWACLRINWHFMDKRGDKYGKD